MIMKPLKERFSLSLDGEVAEEVKKLAEEDDRSFSQFVNIILKEYLKEHKNVDVNKK